MGLNNLSEKTEATGIVKEVTVNYYVSDNSAYTYIITEAGYKILIDGVAPIEKGHSIRATGKVKSFGEFLRSRHPGWPQGKIANYLGTIHQGSEESALEAREITDATAGITYIGF